jgi:hypothetical protein
VTSRGIQTNLQPASRTKKATQQSRNPQNDAAMESNRTTPTRCNSQSSHLKRTPHSISPSSRPKFSSSHPKSPSSHSTNSQHPQVSPSGLTRGPMRVRHKANLVLTRPKRPTPHPVIPDQIGKPAQRVRAAKTPSIPSRPSFPPSRKMPQANIYPRPQNLPHTTPTSAR